VYTLLESLPIDIFAVALIFAHGPLYATYAHAPRLWGIPPMRDQQIVACETLVPGTFFDFMLISMIFFAWFRRMERDQQREDERLAALDEDRGRPPDGRGTSRCALGTRYTPTGMACAKFARMLYWARPLSCAGPTATFAP
jgi:hypothetical protein